MSRLTTNNEVSKMGMYELALNSCYIQDGLTRYRDFARDIDARDFARELMISFGEWKKDGADTDNEIVDDDVFDDTIFDNLAYEPNTITGLIALFYRNLWVMAELREKLKQYETAEEQGLLLKLPCKIGDTAYYVHKDYLANADKWVKIIDEVEVDSFVINTKLLVNVSLYINGDRFPKTLTPYKRLFFTREGAEKKLKEMESDGK